MCNLLVHNHTPVSKHIYKIMNKLTVELARWTAYRHNLVCVKKCNYTFICRNNLYIGCLVVTACICLSEYFTRWHICHNMPVAPVISLFYAHIALNHHTYFGYFIAFIKYNFFFVILAKCYLKAFAHSISLVWFYTAKQPALLYNSHIILWNVI